MKNINNIATIVQEGFKAAEGSTTMIIPSAKILLFLPWIRKTKPKQKAWKTPIKINKEVKSK